MNVMVLTGDHDMLQLINDRTSIIIMKKATATTWCIRLNLSWQRSS